MAITEYRTRPALWLAGLLLTLSFCAQANRTPLVLEGKESLYQRVLTAPGARLYDGAGGKSTTDLVPFSALYVYARKQAAGRDWIEVGSNSHGKTSGWLPARDSLPWHQGLTVAFRDPAGQDRALLYRSREDVRKVIADPARYKQLYQRPSRRG